MSAYHNKMYHPVQPPQAKKINRVWNRPQKILQTESQKECAGKKIRVYLSKEFHCIFHADAHGITLSMSPTVNVTLSLLSPQIFKTW